MNKEQLEANLKKGYSLVTATKAHRCHSNDSLKYLVIKDTPRGFQQVDFRSIKQTVKNFGGLDTYHNISDFTEGAKILLNAKSRKALNELIKETYPEEFI